MAQFIINKNQQPTGEHEVHDLSAYCNQLPAPENQIDLGYHSSCQQAVSYARTRFSGSIIDGCAHCVPACHTR